MRTLNKLKFLAISIAICFFFDACTKELVKSTVNSTLHGRDFAILDPSVKDSVMVMTPDGPRLRSDIHMIPAGHRLIYNGTHLEEIETSTNKLVHDFGVQAPLKYLASYRQNSSRFHTNNRSESLNSINGASKSANKTFNANTVPEGPTPTGGWKTWAGTSSTNKGLISQTTNPSFSASWTVPSLPTDTADGQNVFIFDSVCDTLGNNIVQPVLQFGNNGGGGWSNAWSIFSNYIGCEGCKEYPSSYVKVNPGTKLTGLVQVKELSFTISFDLDSSLILSDTGEMTKPFTTYYEALEGYNLKSANDYPPGDSVAMSALFLEKLQAGANPDNSFGEHTEVTNTSGEAYLYFRSAALPVPKISYTNPVGFTKGVQITSLSPTNTGGIANSFSMSPIPAGLAINSNTGVISGTPTAVDSAVYTVTATNDVGNGTFPISIKVWPAPVLTDQYGGSGGKMIFTVTPNIPSPVTGQIIWKDLTSGANGINEGSPYGYSYTFSQGDEVQVYFIEYGKGSPGSATSNTVTFTVP